MGAFFGGLGSFFGTLFAPIHTVFSYIFFQPVFNVLMLIYQGVHSFGLAIILLTLLIRGALYPLMRKQLASSRRMQEIQPKLKAIQAQYRGDNAGLMAAQQALYKEHGVSMYGGCLPLLIQMPFLYALYYAVYQLVETKASALHDANALIYPFLPHLAALPNTNFLGFSLATANWPLAILAGVLTFVQMRMSLPVTAPSATKDTTTQTAKTMQYIMPFFTAYIGTRFPGGLALYWAVSTGFSAVQQYFVSGWGSLFVGIPGMERFVPEPKAAPTAITAPVSPTRRNGAPETVVEASPPPGGIFGRLREGFRQIQEQAAAQATANRSAADARRGAAPVVDEDDASDGVAEAAVAAPATPKPSATARERRQRSSRSGATLVRPTTPSGAAPEKRLIEENSGVPAGSSELPEKRIAREARQNTGGNGASGANGSSRSYAGGGNRKQAGQNGHSGSRGGQSGARDRGRGSR